MNLTVKLHRPHLLEDAEIAWAYGEQFAMWLFLLLWAATRSDPEPL